MNWLTNLFKGKQMQSALIPDYAEMVKTIQVDKNRTDELKILCDGLKKNMNRYQNVGIMLGIPWQFIAAIHYREADCDFGTCLHNGDALPGPTKHVPSGRGPFKSWEEAAIDALKFDNVDKNKDWSLAKSLQCAEQYNGLGYEKHRVYSPYVFAGTNFYKSGLYSSDGVFDSSLIDKRFGVAAIIMGLGA